MTPRRSTYLHSLMHAARLAAVGAIAAGAMMLTAPAGNAIPESQIISECDDANNGTYTTTIDAESGKRHSKCCYRDIDGVKHCDNYIDGTYTNTTVNNILEQPPGSPPPPPPAGFAPPADAAEAPPAPPDFGNSEATLWMPPPPAGPAAPPRGEATLAP
jgi:hypothetical protein